MFWLAGEPIFSVRYVDECFAVAARKRLGEPFHDRAWHRRIPFVLQHKKHHEGCGLHALCFEAFEYEVPVRRGFVFVLNQPMQVVQPYGTIEAVLDGSMPEEQDQAIFLGKAGDFCIFARKRFPERASPVGSGEVRVKFDNSAGHGAQIFPA